MTSNDSTTGIDRRSVIKTAATGGALLAGGAGTVTLLTNPVAASSHFEIELADSPGVDSSDGSIAWVATGIQGMLSWENFDDDMASFDWRDEVKVEADHAGDGNFGDNIGSFTIYEVTGRDFGPFGRDEDTADASGADGHITFHVPDPDGQGHHFTGGEQQTSTRSDINGPTWVIVQDEEFRNATDTSDLSYSVPSAVDPGYGLPQQPVHAEDLTLPDEGDTTTYRFTLSKTVTMYNAAGDEVFTEVGEGQFTLEVTNLDGTAEFTGTGQSDAGSGE